MFDDWNSFFGLVKEKEYFKEMLSFIESIYENKEVYPAKENVFKAFELVSPEQVKVIIIGQDPYHEPNQAMGLAFSVPEGEKLPPSLSNIYKEIELETKTMMNYQSGDLTYLANQGVLLLNAYLTVEKGKPLSHKYDFYIEFIKDVIRYLESKNKGYVYLLWGNFAKQFAPLITSKNSLILTSAHPSPLSANRGGFFNTNQFNKTNEYLKKIGKSEINWNNNLIYNLN